MLLPFYFFPALSWLYCKFVPRLVLNEIHVTYYRCVEYADNAYHRSKNLYANSNNWKCILKNSMQVLNLAMKFQWCDYNNYPFLLLMQVCKPQPVCVKSVEKIIIVSKNEAIIIDKCIFNTVHFWDKKDFYSMIRGTLTWPTWHCLKNIFWENTQLIFSIYLVNLPLSF